MPSLDELLPLLVLVPLRPNALFLRYNALTLRQGHPLCRLVLAVDHKHARLFHPRTTE
jgi:hypothetical protein